MMYPYLKAVPYFWLGLTHFCQSDGKMVYLAIHKVQILEYIFR